MLKILHRPGLGRRQTHTEGEDVAVPSRSSEAGGEPESKTDRKTKPQGRWGKSTEVWDGQTVQGCPSMHEVLGLMLSFGRKTALRCWMRAGLGNMKHSFPRDSGDAQVQIRCTGHGDCVALVQVEGSMQERREGASRGFAEPDNLGPFEAMKKTLKWESIKKFYAGWKPKEIGVQCLPRDRVQGRLQRNKINSKNPRGDGGSLWATEEESCNQGSRRDRKGWIWECLKVKV